MPGRRNRPGTVKTGSGCLQASKIYKFCGDFLSHFWSQSRLCAPLPTLPQFSFARTQGATSSAVCRRSKSRRHRAWRSAAIARPSAVSHDQMAGDGRSKTPLARPNVRPSQFGQFLRRRRAKPSRGEQHRRRKAAHRSGAASGARALCAYGQLERDWLACARTHSRLVTWRDTDCAAGTTSLPPHRGVDAHSPPSRCPRSRRPRRPASSTARPPKTPKKSLPLCGEPREEEGGGGASARAVADGARRREAQRQDHRP